MRARMSSSNAHPLRDSPTEHIERLDGKPRFREDVRHVPAPLRVIHHRSHRFRCEEPTRDIRLPGQHRAHGQRESFEGIVLDVFRPLLHDFARFLALAGLQLTDAPGDPDEGRSWLQAYRDLEQPPMVIQNDDVPLRIGNGLSYPRHADLPTLTRGMEARRLHARGSWVQLQFASGEVGWVPASEVLTWNDLSFRS